MGRIVRACELSRDIYAPIAARVFDSVYDAGQIMVGYKKEGGVSKFTFAGSQNPVDFERDARAVEAPVYHSGLGMIVGSFYEGMDAVFNELSPLLLSADALEFNGHSLGCSHAADLAGLCLSAGLTVDRLHLFAPPKNSEAFLRDLLSFSVGGLYAFHNGLDPAPEIPLGERWTQFNLIPLNEAPGIIEDLNPIAWHHIDLYLSGVTKYEAIL